MDDYISKFTGQQLDAATDKVLNGGVPLLDESGKVPDKNLPDYVPKKEKGMPNGVASLDEIGKILPSQIPLISIPHPTFVLSTMLASGWVDNAYSFEADYPPDQYNIQIEVAPTATVDQFEAFGEAMICGSATENVATALNGAPTVDIPIIVKVVAK